METWPVGEERQGGLVIVPEVAGYGEPGVACPVCGYTYMHVESWEEPRQGSHDVWYSFVLWGECEHRVRVALNEHKGALLVTTRRLIDTEEQERAELAEEAGAH